MLGKGLVLGRHLSTNRVVVRSAFYRVKIVNADVFVFLLEIDASKLLQLLANGGREEHHLDVLWQVSHYLINSFSEAHIEESVHFIKD